MNTSFSRYVTTMLCAALPCLLYSSSRADMSTLDTLLAGNSLISGNTVYSNFELLADLGTSSVDFSQVNVETLSGSNGLVFQSSDQFVLDAGNESIIFQIGFDAETTGTAWRNTGVDRLDGNAIVSGGGLIDIFNSVSDASDQPLANTNAILDPSFGIDIDTDQQTLGGPFSSVNFDTSLTLFADAAGGVAIDSFRVTLAVPEPNSVLIVAAMLGWISSSRRRHS